MTSTQKNAAQMSGPSGASLSEAHDFLQQYQDVEAIDVILTDANGIGRGKIIRRHELEALFTSGRGLPGSLFAQDISGDDVEAALGPLYDGGGDSRVWPVAGTLGYNPTTGRGIVLITMYDAKGAPHPADPRHVMMRQIKRAQAMGAEPMGAMELEFYLVDRDRNGAGRYQPARYPLTGRSSQHTNTMSVDELDEMSPFFDAVYAGAKTMHIPLETLISEYAAGQYEMTLRYCGLARAADDIILAKRLIRSTARRFGMEACFMAKPFGDKSGSGMHLHLSLADGQGANMFGDPVDGGLSPMMLATIGGIRAQMGDTMMIMAPFLNSWRRFASTVYSPATNTWGQEDRDVALRIPEGGAKTRHFEHRIAGVDANPYLVAAVTLGTGLNGIEAGAAPGQAGVAGAAEFAPLPSSWAHAIDQFKTSSGMRDLLGDAFHKSFAAVKQAEYEALASVVTDVEWDLYGFTV